MLRARQTISGISQSRMVTFVPLRVLREGYYEHEPEPTTTGYHSITSSASATKFGGRSMAVAFAVFRLITNG